MPKTQPCKLPRSGLKREALRAKGQFWTPGWTADIMAAYVLQGKPWYRMESRKIPPILFAYLGRRSARFIRNRANVVPLTCLLCVYPRHSSSEFIARLWRVLSNPKTISNLRTVGKSYGGDAIKVEPRSLERLPLPDDLVRTEGLAKYLNPKQGALDFSEDVA